MVKGLNRVLIVGGGMACAIALRGQGVNVEIFESDPDWKVYGAGLTITSPTLRAAELLGHACGFLRFLEVERGPLTIRRIGEDAAVMTGAMTKTVKHHVVDERVIVHAFVTQVWVRQDGTWRAASFHAARLPEKES